MISVPLWRKIKRQKTFLKRWIVPNRYAILYRIHDAKKRETRTARIEKYVAMLIEGKRIYPQKAKP